MVKYLVLPCQPVIHRSAGSVINHSAAVTQTTHSMSVITSSHTSCSTLEKKVMFDCGIHALHGVDSLPYLSKHSHLASPLPRTPPTNPHRDNTVMLHCGNHPALQGESRLPANTLTRLLTHFPLPFPRFPPLPRTPLTNPLRDKKVMFDCGIHPALQGENSLPYLSSEDLETIDVALITHFHLDHCAAVPYLLQKTVFKVKQTHCWVNARNFRTCALAHAL